MGASESSSIRGGHPFLDVAAAAFAMPAIWGMTAANLRPSDTAICFGLATLLYAIVARNRLCWNRDGLRYRSVFGGWQVRWADISGYERNDIAGSGSQLRMPVIVLFSFGTAERPASRRYVVPAGLYAPHRLQRFIDRLDMALARNTFQGLH